jgi:EAL domain-containing protein (putative c-di-GMP-specific phosphodiesterase class I)
MELVRDIDANYMKAEMARAVKEYADKTESSVIAEGIEREGELEVIRELGIQYGQGYLLGRPGPSFEYIARPTRPVEQQPAADPARAAPPAPAPVNAQAPSEAKPN